MPISIIASFQSAILLQYQLSINLIRHRRMIPDKNTLTRFLKARMNFFVYGPRASGKTTLLKEIFHDANIQYIYINCTMGDKKNNFFKYLNHEFDKFFRKKLKQDGRASKYLEQAYIKPPDPTNVHAWIQNIKSLGSQVRDYLHNIYFFIDNIEEIHVSANFMTTFFSACQQNMVDDLKIPFVFCGITLPKKVYAVDKPFRNIISFCMKKPTDIMLKVIKDICRRFFTKNFHDIKDFKKKFTIEDIQKGADLMANQLYAAFEPMETDLNRVKKMASILGKEISDEIVSQIKFDEESKKPSKQKSLESRILTKINNGGIKSYTRQMLEQGPVGDFILMRKVSKQMTNDEPFLQLPYEYYPQLILTSLHLADQAPESEDKRRFQDYKKQKGKARTNLQNRIAKHNLQRVIAISEALQSSSEKHGPQHPLEHHSINYFACFQFLRQEEKIYIQGKNYSFASTKIYGDTKVDEAIYFMKTKMDLEYKDYIMKS